MEIRDNSITFYRIIFFLINLNIDILINDDKNEGLDNHVIFLLMSWFGCLLYFEEII